MVSWCEPDDCPITICGGPHYRIIVQNGDEIIVSEGQAARIVAAYGTDTSDKSLGDILLAINQKGESNGEMGNEDGG